MVKTTIDEAIARVEDWKGKKISYSSVDGGITNPNFKINVDGTDFFLKIPGEGTDFIDRPNCHIANVIADESGAGFILSFMFSPNLCAHSQLFEEIFFSLRFARLTFSEIGRHQLITDDAEAFRPAFRRASDGSK